MAKSIQGSTGYFNEKMLAALEKGEKKSAKKSSTKKSTSKKK